jgi:hypothetical protein
MVDNAREGGLHWAEARAYWKKITPVEPIRPILFLQVQVATAIRRAALVVVACHV